MLLAKRLAVLESRMECVRFARAGQESDSTRHQDDQLLMTLQREVAFTRWVRSLLFVRGT